MKSKKDFYAQLSDKDFGIFCLAASGHLHAGVHTHSI